MICQWVFGHHGLAGGPPIRGLLGVIHVIPAIPACPVATKPRQAGVWLGEGADQDLDGHRHYQGEQSQCRGNLGCYELSVVAKAARNLPKKGSNRNVVCCTAYVGLWH